MGFFNPSREFLLWLIQRAKGRTIIDGGAGECQLADGLAKLYRKVIAVEPYPKVRRNFLLPLRLHKVSLVRSSPCLIVCARPDHSGWVGEIPGYVHHNSEIIYVGLRKNLFDLDGLEFDVIPFGELDGADVVASIKPQYARTDYQELFIDVLSG